VPGGHAGTGPEERRVPAAQAGAPEGAGGGDTGLAAAGTPPRGEGLHRQGDQEDHSYCKPVLPV